MPNSFTRLETLQMFSSGEFLFDLERDEQVSETACGLEIGQS